MTEKYQEAFELCHRKLIGGWSFAEIARAKEFAHWFTYSDWDDPEAAWDHYITTIEQA